MFINTSINTSDLLLARACHGYYFRFTAFQHERLYWLLAFRNTSRAKTWREERADMSCVVGRFGDFSPDICQKHSSRNKCDNTEKCTLFWPGLESLLCTEDKRYMQVPIDTILTLNLWRMCAQRTKVRKKKPKNASFLFFLFLLFLVTLSVRVCTTEQLSVRLTLGSRSWDEIRQTVFEALRSEGCLPIQRN